MKLPAALTATYGIRGVLAALLALVMLSGMIGCTVQTVRIEGFRVDPPLLPAFGPKGLKAKLAEAEADLAAFIKAGRDAKRLAQAARQADEADIVNRAKDTDNAINQARAGAAGATERFITAGGLPDHDRSACRSVASGPLHRPGDSATVRSPPQLDGTTPLPAIPPAEIVRVTGDDVRICTDNTILAEEQRDLLLGLEARSEALP